MKAARRQAADLMLDFTAICGGALSVVSHYELERAYRWKKQATVFLCEDPLYGGTKAKWETTYHPKKAIQGFYHKFRDMGYLICLPGFVVTDPEDYVKTLAIAPEGYASGGIKDYNIFRDRSLVIWNPMMVSDLEPEKIEYVAGLADAVNIYPPNHRQEWKGIINTAEKFDLTMVAGSDARQSPTLMQSYTTFDIRPRNVNELITAVKEKKCTAVTTKTKLLTGESDGKAKRNQNPSGTGSAEHTV